MVEGGMTVVKYLLFAFNVLFVVTGLALIICGALVQTKFHDYFDFFGEEFSVAAIIIIVVGCIIFFIAAFGCIGAWTENYICTMVFAGLLITIFILELAGGITAFVLKNKFESFASKNMNNSMSYFNESDHQSTTNLWKTTQKTFQCCGVKEASDWVHTPYFQHYHRLPTSCCNTTVPAASCDTREGHYNHIWDQGCIEGMESWVKHNAIKIGAAGVAIAFIQIIGIIFACCLAKSIRKEYEVV